MPNTDYFESVDISVQQDDDTGQYYVCAYVGPFASEADAAARASRIARMTGERRDDALSSSFVAMMSGVGRA